MKANPVSTRTLYFKKFKYKVRVQSNHLCCVSYSEDVDDFKYYARHRLEDEFEFSTKAFKKQKLKEIKGLAPLVRVLLSLRKTHEKKNELRFRNDYFGVTFFTNDDKIIERVSKIAPNCSISEAVPAPQGVLQFSREPPAKFRVYLKNIKIPIEAKAEFNEYVEKTTDLKPSDSLGRFLYRPRSGYNGQVWMNAEHFMNYNHEQTLMMLHLMFPGIIGKTYKLEKK